LEARTTEVESRVGSKHSAFIKLREQLEGLRAAIRAGTELQALAFQTEESKAYMSRFRRDGETVSGLLSERDSAYSDYRERDK
jgi:enoyl-CoA hydratase